MTINKVKPPGWGIGDKLTSGEISSLDANVASALDKRAGQTDVCESDVTVTGDWRHDGTVQFANDVEASGLTEFRGPVSVYDPGSFSCANAVPAQFAGDVVIDGVNGRIKTTNGGRIVLSDGDYPVLAAGHPGRTIVRQISPGAGVMELVNKASAAGATSSDDLQAPSTSTLRRTFSSLFFATVDAADASFVRAVMWDLNPYLIDGATITQVQVAFRGAPGHVGLPARKPSMSARVVTPSIDDTMHSTAIQIFDTSASTTTYQTVHALTATCDQNNVVNKSANTYYAAFMNEGGANALANLLIADITITQTITELRPA